MLYRPVPTDLDKLSMNKKSRMMGDCHVRFCERLSMQNGGLLDYQIVSMVARTDCLNEEEKYSYTRQLRACLDSEEQSLFYYNAMSDVGHKWIDKPTDSVTKINQMPLIARFRMIKNISFAKCHYGLNPKSVFKQEIEIWKDNHASFFELTPDFS